MKPYVRYQLHFIRNSGGRSGKELAELPEEEFAEYLKTIDFSGEKKKYRIKPGFILREIAGEQVIVPVDEESLITNAVMTPNDTAAFLWNVFQQPMTKEDAVMAALKEYDATEEIIRNSTDRFVEASLTYKILEEAE